MEVELNYDHMSAPRYTGIAIFMRTPLVRDPSRLDIALIGVPFHGGVENRPGQRHGPREIRNMSSSIRTVHHVTNVNPYELCRIADMADVPITSTFDLEGSPANITEFYREVHAAGVVPLSAALSREVDERGWLGKRMWSSGPPRPSAQYRYMI